MTLHLMAFLEGVKVVCGTLFVYLALFTDSAAAVRCDVMWCDVL
jgi:hypothetical protein